MRPDRKNLDKLKDLCSSLADRDSQLKINASTLWVILDKVKATTILIDEIISRHECTDTAEEGLRDVLKNLGEIKDLADTRGCKRVSKNV